MRILKMGDIVLMYLQILTINIERIKEMFDKK